MRAHTKYPLKVFQTGDALDTAAAGFIIAIAEKSVAERGQFIISLSGGQTPETLYKLLAQSPFRERLPWKRTSVFWGDERCVPLDDRRNNAHQAKSILLDKVDVPASQVHVIQVNLPPGEAADSYEKELSQFFGKEPWRFDLILLGLGENGHTASLFPGTKVIDDQTPGVREVYVKDENMFRVTLTAPLINQARHVLFMVTGENKAQILREVFTDFSEPVRFPAQLIHPVDGELNWFMDRAAASLIAI